MESQTDIDKRDELERLYPIKRFTIRSILVTSVIRMRAEREQKLPIHLRAVVPISSIFNTPTNRMTDNQWEKFYMRVCILLKGSFPENYWKLFPYGHEETQAGTEASA